MASRAEGEARIDAERNAPRRGLVPARPDPQPLADGERRELRPARTHPVLVVDSLDREPGRRDAGDPCGFGDECARISLHRQDGGHRPGGLHCNRLRAGFEQRIAERLGRRPLEFQRQR
jgi:hypothetical protein